MGDDRCSGAERRGRPDRTDVLAARLAREAREAGWDQAGSLQTAKGYSLRIEGDQDDVAVAFTTSGESRNVVAALEAAVRSGLTTVALTGGRGSALEDLVNIRIGVPSLETARVQEVHLIIGHAICELVDALMLDD